jgi:hypothetical protein
MHLKLVRKCEVERPLERLRLRWKYDLKNIRYKIVAWIYVTELSLLWRRNVKSRSINRHKFL